MSFYNEFGILTLNAKQFDTGRKFIFNIMENDEAFDIRGCKTYIRIQKADGTQFQGDACCKIEGINSIVVDTSIGNGNQILAAPGVNQCELHLEDDNGICLTTWTFNIYVEKRVHNAENLSSYNSFDVIDNMIVMEKDRIENEIIRKQNEERRIISENKRIDNEIQRQRNEDIRKNNEADRNNNENQRINDEDLRKQAEQIRDNNENTRILSENQRINDETQRKAEEKIRQDNENDRKKTFNTVLSQAQTYATSASISAYNTKESEKKTDANVITSSICAYNAKESETNCKISENESKKSEISSNISAFASATSASISAYSAKEAESWARGHTGIRQDENTNNSEFWCQQSQLHKSASEISVATASICAYNAKQSELIAKDSQTESKKSELAAADSATKSETNKNIVVNSVATASICAFKAKEKAEIAENYANTAQSYAIGTNDVVRPNDSQDNSKFYSELARQLTDEAQKLLDQAQKLVFAATAGAIIPSGTVTFENLPEDPRVGYMYNISNDFTTDSRFVEGAGIFYRAGANIYWTKDGKWDVMIGTQVTGVKGDSESTYRVGNVNITKTNIGLGNVNNTADANKHVASAKTITEMLPISKGGTGKTTGAEAIKALVNSATTGADTPADNDWYLCQWANGSSNGNETPVRRKMSSLWNYISTKMSPLLNDKVNKTGDTLSGRYVYEIGSAIALRGPYRTSDVITFIPDKNTSDNYGNGVRIGTDGFVLIASGESGDRFQDVSGAYEAVYIASDQEIRLMPGCQNGHDINKDTVCESSGRINTPFISARKHESIVNGVLQSLTAGQTQLMGDGLWISNPAIKNDQGWIRMLGTGENDSVLEIATGDDGGAGERIVVRQYNTANGVAHELVLLENDGHTGFKQFVTIDTANGIDGDIRFYRNGQRKMYIGTGSGNTNHGIWDYVLGKWMVYSNGANIYLNGTAEKAKGIQATNGALYTISGQAYARNPGVVLGFDTSGQIDAYNTASLKVSSAIQDVLGNNIHETYLKKTDLIKDLQYIGTQTYDAYEGAGYITFANTGIANANYLIVAEGASSNSSSTGNSDYGRVIFITGDTRESSSNFIMPVTLGSFYSGTTARFAVDKSTSRLSIKVNKGSWAMVTAYELKAR